RGLRIGVVGLAERGGGEGFPAQPVFLAAAALALAFQDARRGDRGQAHAVAEEQDHVLRATAHGAARRRLRRAVAEPPGRGFVAGMADGGDFDRGDGGGWAWGGGEGGRGGGWRGGGGAAGCGGGGWAGAGGAGGGGGGGVGWGGRGGGGGGVGGWWGGRWGGVGGSCGSCWLGGWGL